MATAIGIAKTFQDPNAGLKEKLVNVSLLAIGSVGEADDGQALAPETRRLPFAGEDRIAQVNRTLDRIEAGGPFPYVQDGQSIPKQ